MEFERPLDRSAWQKLKGRCISCGFLCQRIDLMTETVYEATVEARNYGNLVSHPESPRATRIWCFVYQEPLWEEFRRLSAQYGNTRDNAEINFEIITRDINCPEWYPYTPFMSPKEHLKKLNSSEVEQKRNKTANQYTLELPKLTSGEILKLVNEYIGVHGGYLGDFTYRTHQEFYPQFCDVEANPNDYEGTTRERFIKILQNSNNEAQVKIIHGVLKKYTVGSESQRTQQLFDHFNSLANRLKGVAAVPNPDLVTASVVLRRVLADAETLIQQSGAVSAVDRIHTALHGYLIAVCDKSKIEYEKNPSLTRLFRLLRDEHPALAQVGTGSEEIGRILQACATIMDALNPLRNKLSVAHPNEQLLGDEEAMLVVNITRTLLHYFDAKFTSY